MSVPAREDRRPPRQIEFLKRSPDTQMLEKDPQNAPSTMMFRNIKYPSTSFETVLFTFLPIVNAIYDIEPTFTSLPSHRNNFYPKYTKGRGVGLFAGRDFVPGETIILERPAMVLPLAMHPQYLEHSIMLMDRLPSDEHLSASLLSSCKPDRPWISGMTSTNSFGFDLPVPHREAMDFVPWWNSIISHTSPPNDLGWKHAMIFLTAARLNYS
jgi:hypothetical protein